VRAALAASPVGRWPLYQLETGEPFDMAAWYNWVGAVGAACWLAAYVLVIVLCRKQTTYGVPLVAICLNCTWELMDSFFLPDPVPVWVLIDRSWFLVDVLIVSQLLRFGKKEQIWQEVQKAFFVIVALTLGFAFIGQYAWVTTFHDTLGIILAFVINLVMSALYLPFYFTRRNSGHGLSLPVAWLKMIGTALSSIQCHFLIPLIHPVAPSTTHLGPYAFLHFMFVACFVLDVAYIVLLMTSNALPTSKAQPTTKAA
jgi:hypothetical protein